MYPVLLRFHSDLFLNVYFILLTLTFSCISLFIVKSSLSKNQIQISKFEISGKILTAIKIFFYTISVLSVFLILLSLIKYNQNVELDTYSIFFGMGYVISTLLAYHLIKNTDVDESNFLIFIVVITVFSYLGAKLFFGLFEYSTETYPPPLAFFNNPLILFNFKGGYIIYGGLITGILSGLIFLKIKKMPVKIIADISSICIFLGIFFGRLGCMFNGCCFGKKTTCSSIFTAKWKSFTKYTGTYDFHSFQNTVNYDIVNTQLISSLFALVMFALFLYIYLKHYEKFKGLMLVLAFIVYPIFRFIIEFFRADNPNIYFKMTLSQIISLIIFTISLITLFIIKFKKHGQSKNV